jgi:hypothetical protein
MRRQMRWWWLGLSCSLAIACGKEELGDSVPAAEGAVQPDGNGVAIDEQTACLAIVEAEDATRERLGCEPAERAPCPDYIRPAGARVCLMYDEGSVEACVRVIRDYEACSAFHRQPCVITALDQSGEGCPLGEAGAAGAGGGAAGAGATAGGGGSVAGWAGGGAAGEDAPAAGSGGSAGVGGSAGEGGRAGGGAGQAGSRGQDGGAAAMAGADAGGSAGLAGAGGKSGSGSAGVAGTGAEAGVTLAGSSGAGAAG